MLFLLPCGTAAANTTTAARCLARRLPLVATTTGSKAKISSGGCCTRSNHRLSSLVMLFDHDEAEYGCTSITTNRQSIIVGSGGDNEERQNSTTRSHTSCRHFNNSQQQQQPQKRWLATHAGGGSGKSSSNSKGYYKHASGRGKKEQDCPFVVLGLVSTPRQTPKNGDGDGRHDISYTIVKKTFLKIAMRHHPDTSTSKTKEEQDEDKEIFLASLHAFEKLAADPNGIAVLKSELEGYQDNDSDDLNAWFKQETGGFDMPFMDARTVKEVAEMTTIMGGGLDRDGGMWTLARMVTESAKSGHGDGMNILQLEAGNIRDKKINGILRRKRNR